MSVVRRARATVLPPRCGADVPQRTTCRSETRVASCGLAGAVRRDQRFAPSRLCHRATRASAGRVAARVVRGHQVRARGAYATSACTPIRRSAQRAKWRR
ncbi:hypothetical protein DB32_008218 [Sandaracinus amylolyticus]|uniref:Uncharacterized protein n=1 Tax=Sandaracinus amylolyticus TaxID=927083 RepID=A0A0F6SHU8_9BACT|nr:hypothetical protein DB32_008218 [Sandaracinus amylolyticus]